MSKSLAELRLSPDAALPERTYRICLAQKVVAKVFRLESEKSDLEVESERNADGEKKSNARAVDAPDPRIAEIDAELAALYDVMRDHTGELLIRGVDQGTWGRWTDQHPPREDNRRDEDGAYGFCNADDLIADLGRYVVEHNGEPLGPGDWDFLKSKAAPGDLKEIARIVVQMHEVTGAVPKSLNASSDSRSDAND